MACIAYRNIDIMSSLRYNLSCMSYQRTLDIVNTDNPRLSMLLATAKSADTQGKTLRIFFPQPQVAREVREHESYLKSVAEKAYGRKMNIEVRC